MHGFEPRRMVKLENKQINFSQAPTWDTILFVSGKLNCK